MIKTNKNHLFSNNLGVFAGLQQVTSEQRVQLSVNIFIHVQILDGHIVTLLQVDDHGASGRVVVSASTATNVHSVHQVAIVRQLKVVVVVSMGENGRAEYVRAGHRRCKRSLARSVAIAIVCNDVVKAEILTHSESPKMVCQGSRKRHQRCLCMAGNAGIAFYNKQRCA